MCVPGSSGHTISSEKKGTGKTAARQTHTRHMIGLCRSSYEVDDDTCPACCSAARWQ